MIHVESTDGIALVRFERPPANAIELESAVALEETLARLEADAETCAVVLTGHGEFFSAGLDLKVVPTYGPEQQRTMVMAINRLLGRLYGLGLPAVAAVNGHAIAGGAIIACACDYRLMVRGAGKIGVPELRVGVPFPMVPAEIVRYALGPQRGQRAMLVGHVVEAERSVEEGFVDELIEPERLMERSLAAAATMAATPLESYARTKADLRRPVMEIWARLRAAHDRETLEAWHSPEVRSAIEAYVEKTLRRPS